MTRLKGTGNGGTESLRRGEEREYSLRKAPEMKLSILVRGGLGAVGSTVPKRWPAGRAPGCHHGAGERALRATVEDPAAQLEAPWQTEVQRPGVRVDAIAAQAAMAVAQDENLLHPRDEPRESEGQG